ncbi:MAG: hypothetical protein K5989_00940, partial [Lachnospiraceae bacterium]|nr:hypothetical protein [Lachnospiraceae bacterium]
LMDLENKEYESPHLERERLKAARNLRTIMVTDIGILDKDGKSYDEDLVLDQTDRVLYGHRIGSVIKRNKEYLDLSEKVLKLIQEKVAEDELSRDITTSDQYRDRLTYAMSEYFVKDIVEDMKKHREFKEDRWRNRIQKAYQDKVIWNNLALRSDGANNEEYEKFQNSKHETGVGEADIARAIRQHTYVFKGRVNKYEKLDEDQKKIFALALVLMDKGSIGYGTEGTMALLNSTGDRQKNADKIQAQLEAYVRGQEVKFDVNYKEAYNKLVNYGESSFFYVDKTTLSVTAYERAMKFTRAITAKKQAFIPKDMERLNNGFASINTAYLKYDKKQVHEIEKLREETLTIEDVRKKILQYAEGDVISGGRMIGDAVKGGKYGPIRGAAMLDKDAAFNTRMKKISDRLTNMSESDLKLFVRLLQERTVLDTKTGAIDNANESFVHQEKRNALREALTSDVDVRAEVLKGFDDADSCQQALISALSFQLRDDVDIRGKDLTEGHFKSGALNRKTLIDWELVERAFSFMDEIKEQRAFTYATSHASDYIEQSGNKEAIAENRKFQEKYKKKADFTQMDFDDYIERQAKKDKDESVSRALAGYFSLTEKEKNLFFKVLGRRDYLDISRKKYIRSFFGNADRDYLNGIGRNMLIDQYIQSSLENNAGIILEENDRYNAMKSLFSTQLSDRGKFDNKEDISKKTVVERNFFMGRNTAIDWKLFKRALNFVIRASEELEYVEGNAQLYRGAGDLYENGRMNMKYNFLRKNFHRTGNQFARFAAGSAARKVVDVVGKDPLDAALVSIDTISFIPNMYFSDKGSVKKGLAWLRKQTADMRQLYKESTEEKTYSRDITILTVDEQEQTEEEKAKAEAKEKKRRDNLLYLDHIKEGIDGIIAQSKSAGNAALEIVNLLKTNAAPIMADQFEFMKPLTTTRQVAASPDKDNYVEQINKKGTEDASYGDIRDTGKLVKDKYQDFKNIASEIQSNYKKLDKAGMAPEFIKTYSNLVSYAVEKNLYKLVNDNLIHGTIKLTQKKDETREEFEQRELQEYQKAINKYASDMFEDIMKKTVGEKTAKKLLSFENEYYNIKKGIDDRLKIITNGVTYAKKCVAHVENVAKSVENYRLLDNVSEKSQNMRAEDEEKLKNAGQNGRLSEEQTAKVQNIMDKHRGMESLAKDVGQAVQGFNIAENVINFTIETATIAGGKLNVGQELLAKAIKQGLEFAMFAMKICSDRNSLAAYFKNTEAGQAVVDKVRRGLGRTGDPDLQQSLTDALKKDKTKALGSLVDIISDARGYEHTSELVENTAMSMAQSIIFCASNYNPMAETKLMAITVMSVMGLESEIGNTSPETVEKLFNSFQVK